MLNSEGRQKLCVVEAVNNPKQTKMEDTKQGIEGK